MSGSTFTVSSSLTALNPFNDTNFRSLADRLSSQLSTTQINMSDKGKEVGNSSSDMSKCKSFRTNANSATTQTPVGQALEALNAAIHQLAQARTRAEDAGSKLAAAGVVLQKTREEYERVRQEFNKFETEYRSAQKVADEAEYVAEDAEAEYQKLVKERGSSSS